MNISAEQHFSSQSGSSQTRRAEMRGGMSRFLKRVGFVQKKTPHVTGFSKTNAGYGSHPALNGRTLPSDSGTQSIPQGPECVQEARPKKKRPRRDSNPQPALSQKAALSVELRGRAPKGTQHLIGVVAVAICLLTVQLPGVAFADDSQPTAQAEAINGEFLASLPAPTGSKAICIVDTGVSITPDLEDAVIARYALDGGSVEDLGSSQHGTQVAMAAVGKTGNGWGSAGIWPSADLISVRASSVDDPDHFTWSEYRDGIDQCNYGAAAAGVTLAAISLSLGASTATDAEADADGLAEKISREQAADRYDTSVIAGAGNDSATAVSYPARFEGVFAVGATSASGGAFCDFSNRGEGLDISAPGCDTNGSDISGNAEEWRGTSFSAPITAAVLAALRSYRQDLTAVEAEQLLLDTAQTTSAGKVVDADAAFRAAGLGDYVDAYTPPATGGSTTDNSSTSSSEETTSSSNPQTSDSTSYTYQTSTIIYDERYRESWNAPRVRAEWRTRRGTLVIALTGVPKGAELETVNDDIEKTFKLKGRRPIVKVRQDKWSRMPVKLRYVGGEKNPSDRAVVGGYYPLPGRCMENIIERACFTVRGKRRKITKHDRRAINRAQKRYKAHEKRLRDAFDPLRLS